MLRHTAKPCGTPVSPGLWASLELCQLEMKVLGLGLECLAAGLGRLRPGERQRDEEVQSRWTFVAV